MFVVVVEIIQVVVVLVVNLPTDRAKEGTSSPRLQRGANDDEER